MRRAWCLVALLAIACDDGSDDEPAVDAFVSEGDASPPDAAATDADPPQDAGDEGPIDLGGETRMPVVVGLGWQGLTVVSIDEGQSWCQTGIMVDGHDDLFRGGGYHDGLFVGAHAGRSNRGAILVSEDGWQWEALHQTNFDEDLPENPSGQWYGGAAYGNGTWLAAGGCGQLATSADGRSWIGIDRFVDSCLHIRSVAFGDGVFVVGLDDDSWHRSTDGATWELWMEGAGSRVIFDATGFHGEEDGQSRWRGRGLCMWGAGWEGAAHILRSESEDCSDPVRVSDTAHSITTILYGEVSESAFAPDALPSDLRTCLGL